MLFGASVDVFFWRLPSVLIVGALQMLYPYSAKKGVSGASRCMSAVSIAEKVRRAALIVAFGRFAINRA